MDTNQIPMSFTRFIRLPLLLLALGTFLTAQAQQGPRGPRGRLLDTEKMTTALELTEDQVASINDLNTSQEENMKALRDQDFECQEDRRAAGKELMQAYQESLKEILTKDQLKKLRDMRQNQRKRRKAKPEGAGSR